eukprot:CAMPEP_0198255928 /NCGR_PEP_ID=MMETSP1447-20131203/5946_1 /TAXON_ID=420782 /ORGANISM="Chaetoceros dichaeta, Strain CCMP1751" /LENGTH=182 /DNA_ID=CAMNT_0043942429 /DNA_START=109 /DNA_END=657 /DNA_ORIENTATION=-
MTVLAQLPDLPLTCLSTAEHKSMHDEFKGKNHVIDFWTTKCTRCPEALDRIDSMAQDAKYSNVRFTSIVLDNCDGARNIIETPDDEPRWGNVGHYHLDEEYRTVAKEALGFRQVPFYVVLNEEGEVVQKGGKREIDFEAVPGVIREEKEEERKCDVDSGESGVVGAVGPVPMDRVFCMDDDF